MNQIMEGVTEYAEGLDVRLSVTKGRLVVDAKNEGGYNGTDVDLVQLLEWVSKNMPELQPAHKWIDLTDVDLVHLLEWVSKNMPELQPAHKWIDLTDDEMMEVANRANTYTEAVRMTQAKLKEKNT